MAYQPVLLLLHGDRALHRPAGRSLSTQISGGWRRTAMERRHFSHRHHSHLWTIAVPPHGGGNWRGQLRHHCAGPAGRSFPRAAARACAFDLLSGHSRRHGLRIFAGRALRCASRVASAVLRRRCAGNCAGNPDDVSSRTATRRQRQHAGDPGAGHAGGLGAQPRILDSIAGHGHADFCARRGGGVDAHISNARARSLAATCQ